MIINTAMNHKVEYDDKLNSVKNMNMNRNSTTLNSFLCDLQTMYCIMYLLTVKSTSYFYLQ
jgi:hypothetical protein